MAQWFKETMVGKQRKKSLPEASQCAEIASYLNQKLSRDDFWMFLFGPDDRRISDLEKQAAQEANQLLRTLAPILAHRKKLLTRAKDDLPAVDADKAEAVGFWLPSIDVDETETDDFWERNLESTQKNYDECANLFNNLQAYTQRNVPQSSGRKTSLRLIGNDIRELQLLIKKAFEEAGWKRISFLKEGPATVILARCLSFLRDEEINHKTLARRLRELP